MTGAAIALHSSHVESIDSISISCMISIQPHSWTILQLSSNRCPKLTSSISSFLLSSQCLACPFPCTRLLSIRDDLSSQDVFSDLKRLPRPRLVCDSPGGLLTNKTAVTLDAARSMPSVTSFEAGWNSKISSSTPKPPSQPTRAKCLPTMKAVCGFSFDCKVNAARYDRYWG